ncbi:hypothetical protein VTN77DRAFT_1466 [Rasamsonia byssochlamydoides]|uniref:uncharacterized protein n=1 Tax=Rasamsonia byssochlamydoides TaxID=89139 RepID=UPI0037445F49
MGGQVSYYMDARPPPHAPVYKDLVSFVFDDRPVGYDEQRPIYIDAENPSWALNARQFRMLVRTLIAGFKAQNLQPGECVLVHLPNNVLYSAIFFAIIGAGGIYMGTNPRSQPHELEHLLQLAEPKWIITSPDGLPMLREVGTTLKGLSSQICILDAYAIARLSQFLLSTQSTTYGSTDQTEEQTGVLNFASLLDHGESDWIRFDDKATAETTPAAMFTTSGTGGLPKAAILSHHAMVTHHLSIQYPVPYDVTRLMSLPMFHLFGALWSHIFPVRYGQPLYVLPRFEIDQYVRTIYLYRITETYMVPAMVQALNRCSSLALSEYLISLRYIGVAGAALDAVSAKRFQDKLHPDAQISQLWGMTEVGVAFQIRYGERDDTASIGRLTPNYEIKLLDSNGGIVTADNQPGELYVRGPGTLIGYRGMPPAKDEDGWFRTGDIMCVRQGKFYIVGRAKELIKVRGWQVAPAEIEAVLLKHPEIADAAVIGVTQTDPRDSTVVTETVRAFVVRRKGLPANRLTADEVYRFARRQLASYKALDGGVIFVEDIPRTPSGKIQRFKLAQMNSYREMVSSLLLRFEGVNGVKGVGVAGGVASVGLGVCTSSVSVGN